MPTRIKISVRIEILLVLLAALSMALYVVYLQQGELIEDLVLIEKLKGLRVLSSTITSTVPVKNGSNLNLPEAILKSYGIENVKIFGSKFWSKENMNDIKKLGLSHFELLKMLSLGGGIIIIEVPSGIKTFISICFGFEKRKIVIFKGTLGEIDLLVRTGHVSFTIYFSLVLMVVFIVCYLLISYLVARPVQRMIWDIDRIASDKSGNPPVLRDHFANRRIVNELALLNQALAKMSTTIRERENRINQNVEELKTINENLKKAQESLIRTEKLASVGILAAGIAHEIGNPIGTLLGFIEIIKGDENLPDEVKKYAETMEEAAVRISRIIGDLLSFARAGKDDLLYADLESISENTLELLEPQKRFKGVTVKKFYDKERIVCSISPNRLKQVLLNLLLNAADAMNGSGVVEIKTYRLRDTGVIEIKDYGKGIPESDQYKIWDPFFTTKPPGEGTGLGLFMCYQIIKTFGGDISFASRENVGTTFTVKLQYYYEEE